MATEGYFLGLDLGTQQLKALVTDSDFHVKHVVSVGYDSLLPEFGTRFGVHQQGQTVTAPVLMWLKALELALEQLRDASVDLGRIRAVSGAAQQHGSVYWRWGAEEALGNLDPTLGLFEQLDQCFASTDSPVWLDSSTEPEARQLENSVGGPARLAELTGSSAYLRFTGLQILKKYRKEPEVMKETEHISLVSSFLCSLFLGRYAPIDLSDGSGMNLLDIRKHVWAPECLQIFPADLSCKLGACVPSTTCLGAISPFFVHRYGFSHRCQIVVFTGDNPSSLVGLNQQPQDLSVSLGTSDTVFVWMDNPLPLPNGHVFCNPLDSKHYMGLICFTNGDYSRKQTKQRLCGDHSSWQDFEALVESQPPGNHGYVGIFFEKKEIGSSVPAGIYRFDPEERMIGHFEKGVEARALIEHQCLAKRLSAFKTGMRSSMKRILVTGGASTSPAIVGILSNVFNLPVYKKDVQHSAALGGAVRAGQALLMMNCAAKKLKSQSREMLIASPNQSVVEVYNQLAVKYERILGKLESATSGSSNPDTSVLMAEWNTRKSILFEEY